MNHKIIKKMRRNLIFNKNVKNVLMFQFHIQVNQICFDADSPKLDGYFAEEGRYYRLVQIRDNVFFFGEYSCRECMEEAVAKITPIEKSLDMDILVPANMCQLFEGSKYAARIHQFLCEDIPLNGTDGYQIEVPPYCGFEGIFYAPDGKLSLREYLWQANGKFYHAGIAEQKSFFAEISKKNFKEAMIDWSEETSAYGGNIKVLSQFSEVTVPPFFHVNEKTYQHYCS